MAEKLIDDWQPPASGSLTDEPPLEALLINNLQDEPNRSIELPQCKSLI